MVERSRCSASRNQSLRGPGNCADLIVEDEGSMQSDSEIREDSD
ncbi:hypothetical protein RESH_04088 [Rhodopirellula europaea SH398]|uniref:Uncharacterized protein n=1 Tax=Rhodopirellula europaea SH398 TaxID=1263868 RepID=M5S184_9BACT|nr:hypothetical protein RESH_04088 [Rhodopirellula europaea SH398]